MKFADWLDAGRGRLTAVASAFGLTPGAVSQWRESGVPVARMKAVRDLSNGEVTLEDMVPESMGRPARDFGQAVAERSTG